jgi:hypothetical protein
MPGILSSPSGMGFEHSSFDKAHAVPGSLWQLWILERQAATLDRSALSGPP